MTEKEEGELFENISNFKIRIKQLEDELDTLKQKNFLTFEQFAKITIGVVSLLSSLFVILR